MSRTNRIHTLLLVIFIFAAFSLAGGMIWGNLIFTRNNPVEKNFFVPWLNARTFLEYGDSPYSEPSYQRTQILYYGQLASEDEDPLFLWVSFPGELFYIPFALIKEYEVARAVWMTLSEIALILAGFFTIQLLHKKIPKLVIIIIVIFFVFSIFNLMNIISGSPLPFGLLALVGSFIALRNHDDEIAGILLILPFLMQGIFLVFFLFLFWWTFQNRRWGILTGFGMALGILLLLSFLLLPDWLIPSMRGVYWHLMHQPGISIHTFISSIWPVVGLRFGWMITILLSFILLIQWRASRNNTFDHFLWTACITIAITPLLGLNIGVDGYSVLSIPMVLLVSIIADRWPGRKQSGTTIIILSITLLAGWMMMVLSDPRAAMTLPVIISTGLLWVKWWMVKPPRTLIETWQ